MAEQDYDRRQKFTPKPRPEWVRIFNGIGEGLNIRSVVPLTVESLMEEAKKNTGLSDFGEDGWLEHFTVLMESIDAEADLNFTGRLLTRTEFILYLEARLQIVEWYRKHPQIQDEVVDRPVFITGYGRSGTTILFEILSQDPQFRVARKWEGLFPCPPPEEESYTTDPRIAATERVNALIEGILPELGALHKIGGDLPIESLELEYLTFLSDMYPIILQVPRYAAHLEKQDLTSTFEWQKRILKLLQSRYKKKHWLMKSPSHLPHLRKLLSVFPDMRIIFTHRDPLASADSVASFMGNMYWMRTDNVWGRGTVDSWALSTVEDRAKVWDGIIEMIEDGTIAKGHYANFHYDQFMSDPMESVRNIYRTLDLVLSPDVEAKMMAYLGEKGQGKFGKHEYDKTPEDVIRRERAAYAKYQRFFEVKNEFRGAAGENE